MPFPFDPGRPDEHSVAGSIEHGGIPRTFLLHVPPSSAKGSPAPLVLAFHGGGGNARGMEALTGWSALSYRRGFIVACPEGVEKHWNDGHGVASMRAQREGIDDVGFVAHPRP